MSDEFLHTPQPGPVPPEVSPQPEETAAAEPSPAAYPAPPSVAPPQVPYMPPVQYPAPAPGGTRTNSLAVLALIFGILSLVFGALWFVGPVFSAAAIVLAICSRRGDEPLAGTAIAGGICAVVGLVLAVLIFLALINGAMGDMAASMEYFIE